MAAQAKPTLDPTHAASDAIPTAIPAVPSQSSLVLKPALELTDSLASPNASGDRKPKTLRPSQPATSASSPAIGPFNQASSLSSAHTMSTRLEPEFLFSTQVLTDLDQRPEQQMGVEQGVTWALSPTLNPTLAQANPDLETPEAPESNDPESLDNVDPELGILRLREQPLQSEDFDPELGTLRLQEQATQSPPRPSPVSLYLQAKVSYFNSDNVISATDPINDQLLRPGIGLLATSRLGPRTAVSANVEGNIIRYSNLTQLDYNELRLQATLRQQFSSNWYGELGWANQQLFSEANDDERFLNDHSVRLAVARRDLLSRRLRLDSFYQFRASFADPSNRNRVRNTVGASLTYALQKNTWTGVNYQMTWADFTERDRDDFYGQLIARLTQRLSPSSSLTLFGGFGFGDSSEADVSFDDFIFGANLSVNLKLF